MTYNKLYHSEFIIVCPHLKKKVKLPDCLTCTRMKSYKYDIDSKTFIVRCGSKSITYNNRAFRKSSGLKYRSMKYKVEIECGNCGMNKNYTVYSGKGIDVATPVEDTSSLSSCVNSNTLEENKCYDCKTGELKLTHITFCDISLE